MRVVALPFSRQRWLFAVSTSGQMTAPAAPKQTASSFVGWAQSAMSSVSHKAQSMLQRQWDGLVQAPDGSIKNRFYRMAMAVLAREDVTESFLKTIPSNVTQLQLIAPADQPVSAASRERYVRRRMRLMLRQQERLHHCRMVTWLGAIVPSAPLAFLPIPNIPMYYAGYRAWSHWKALKGARQALGLFQQAELSHVHRTHEQQRGQQTTQVASSSPAQAVIVCTAPDLDAAAQVVSSVHETDKAADLANVAAQYDLPDLQEFYERATKQKAA